jgi:hypothetical protein
VASGNEEGCEMANGEENRGRIARAMAGVDGVEIKATIPQHQIQPAMELYGLERNDNERYIYFFDTPGHELIELGIVARARRVVGGQHDSTIKFRPVETDSIPSIWRRYAGFKIEADASSTGIVKSASLTMPVAKGQIKRVASGKEPIASLYNEEQLLFLLSLASKKVDYTSVVTYGPIRAWRWKYLDPGLPWPITGELWRREDEDEIFEVSIKVPVAQAAAAGAGFMAFLAEIGAERDEGQQAKTRWALETVARQHVEAEATTS